MRGLMLAVPGTVRGCLEVVKARGADELICRCVECGEEFIVPRESFFTGRGAGRDVLLHLDWEEEHCPKWYAGKRFGAWTCRGFRNGLAEMVCDCGRGEAYPRIDPDEFWFEVFEEYAMERVCRHEQGIYRLVRDGGGGRVFVKCLSCGDVVEVPEDEWLSGEYVKKHPVCGH